MAGYKRPTVRKLLQEWRDQQQGIVTPRKEEHIPTPVIEVRPQTGELPEIPLQAPPRRARRIDPRIERRRAAEIERRERFLTDPTLIPVKRRGEWGSLTQFINANKELKMVLPRRLRDLLVDQYDQPVQWKAPILVAPRGNFVDIGLIGTAFDYVARAILARNCGENVTREVSLIAEKGIKGLPAALGEAHAALLMFPPKYLLNDKAKYLRQGETLGKLLHDSKAVNKFTQTKLKEVVSRRKAFMDGAGISLEQIGVDALFLARLDEVYRSGGITVVNYYLDTEEQPRLFTYGTLSDQELLDDIRALTNIFEGFLETVSWRSAILNPIFDGDCIHALADGDFIAERTIVDLKAGTSLSCKGDYFAQVFGYAALGLKMGMDIDSVAIHFARFNQFVTIKLDDPVLLKDFPERYLNAMTVIANLDRD